MLLLNTIFCFFSGETSFGLYSIEKSLTLPGWIVLFIIGLISICGIIKIVKYFLTKQGKKLK